ncbi:MAG: type II toxin-antitoxin system HicA family toxin [Spirochaetia bacterium]|nr:type II toxin-antitoxin system HicA family toxin [Spirochaetia bacterium]
MPKYKTLSGTEVIRIFEKYGFEKYSQKGSHVKLRRVIAEQMKQTLTIPNHKEIDRGTLRSIVNQASKYINIEILQKDFMND